MSCDIPNTLLQSLDEFSSARSRVSVQIGFRACRSSTTARSQVMRIASVR